MLEGGYRDGEMERAETFLNGFDRLVVVAPHPDDDVLGCGGLLAASAAAGLEAVVLYVTDGSASHVGSTTYPPARLREVREREARDALAALGVAPEPRFLRVPDGTVAELGDAGAARVVDAIAGAIADAVRVPVRPLLVGPWLRDHHADHTAVAALVRRAHAERPAATLLEYAVWLDELGAAGDRPQPGEAFEIVLDVDAHVAAKTRALAEHRSQLGELITDAESGFVLPPQVIASAGRGYERFLQIL